MPIHVLIALNVPKWFIKVVDKIRRGFLWCGQQNANGGCCLGSWEKVQWPLELGRLGIINFEVMRWALQIWWLWFHKTEPHRPCNGLDIYVHPHALALFNIATESQVRRGNNTLFWKDKWIMGCFVSDLAPLVVGVVSPRVCNGHMGSEGLVDQNWIQDIRAGLSLIDLFEFFQLVDTLDGYFLSQEDDKLVWRLDSSGTYTSKSAYRAFFNGSIPIEPWRRIWKSWVLGKCKIFLWLAARNRCWTADRLAKHNLPHPSRCPLCD
ncbi:hypothetical protein PR202_ga12426 [Eleusine coracana subsp. coracana]|uniref:Reverse transcriptase zinc-binding domain-containing protein n=1 Tax=Eleusine coracana subsp. coracana TaxID=191504 RepID=A0AAV5CC66_ELECO|nr:hypothetical protein PR202_ga12426 [Eleusine coracana subsp. coracana]